MGRSVRIILGPPGTGKTTTLLDRIDTLLTDGMDPQRIGFVSFSRRAVREAIDRACVKFGFVSDDLAWFRTIHSTAFRLLGLTRGEVLQPRHLLELGTMIDLTFTGTRDWEDDARNLTLLEGTLGDRCHGLYHLARARGRNLELEWREARLPDTPWATVRAFARSYVDYKEQSNLVDFSDMLDRLGGQLNLDVLFIDEAQDCSPAQWAFLRRVSSDVPLIYMAGDDDQAIYAWSGADAGALERFLGEREVLPFSYRLPAAVKDVADKVAQRIVHRIPKQFKARQARGSVQWYSEADVIDLHQPGTWLLLARSNYQLRALRELARRQAVVYSLAHGPWSWSLPSVQGAINYERLRNGHAISAGAAKALQAFIPERLPVVEGQGDVLWEDLFPERTSRDLVWHDALPLMPASDREYIRALRRTGESLTKPGRVRVGTVHSAKGSEAEHVLLLTDVSTKIAGAARVDPDAEERVKYVAVTRAKTSLALIRPKTHIFWSF